MGNSKSKELNSLVQVRDPHNWVILDDLGLYQIWQQKQTNKRYQVYLIDSSAVDQEEKLQLYHFRKLNGAHLVSIQLLLTNDTSFVCSQPPNCYILIEHIPQRLSSLHQGLTFKQSLTVLSAAFSGYDTLNYVHGPLYTSDEMICFNEYGIPKVWLNENLSSNEPSRRARGENGDDSVIEGLNNMVENYEEKSSQEKTLLCVREILETVERATTNGFPFEFKTEATARIRNFSEGQQFVDEYCTKRGIQIEEAISLERFRQADFVPIISQRFIKMNQPILSGPKLQFQPSIIHQLPITTNGRLQPELNPRARLPLESTSQKLLRYAAVPPPANLIRTSIQQPIPWLSSAEHRDSVIRSNFSNGVKVNFVFNQQAAARETVREVPTLTKSQNPPLESICLVKSEYHPPQPVQQQPQIAQKIVKVESSYQSVSQAQSFERKQANKVRQREPKKIQLTNSHSDNYQLFVHQVSAISSESDPAQAHPSAHTPTHTPTPPPTPPSAHTPAPPSAHPPTPPPTPPSAHTPTPPPTSAPTSPRTPPPAHQKIAEQIRQLTATISVGEINEPDYRQPQTQQQIVDELKKWEESMLKISGKKKKNLEASSEDEQQYLSEQRDKVLLQEEKNPVPYFANQNELEQYIRKKYSDYFTVESNSAKSIQKPHIERLSFEEDYPSKFQSYKKEKSVLKEHNPPLETYNPDSRKYTFGKIYLPQSDINQSSDGVLFNRFKQGKFKEDKEGSIERRVNRKKSQSDRVNIEEKYSRYVKNKEPVQSRLSNKNISSISREDEPYRPYKKEGHILSQYTQKVNDSSFGLNGRSIVRSPQAEPRNNITYQHLRQILWK